MSEAATGDDALTTDTGVDWTGLYEAYGFDTPDGIGNSFPSPLQLATALEADRDVSGDPDGLIRSAVLDGVLKPVTTTDGEGNDVTRGYIHIGGDS